MKRTMGKVWPLLLALLCISFIIPSIPVMAAAKKAVAPGMACKSGRYIYYGYTSIKKGSGILRYDTKTKKKKHITSGRDKDEFSSLNVKGNYIYAEWRTGVTTDGSLYYICRINRKTGKKKKLAIGWNPVVVGQYIYYEEGTLMNSYTYGTGNICRMTLSGKNKETVKSGIVDENGCSDIMQLFVCGGNVLYEIWTNEKALYTIAGKKISRSSLKIEEDIYHWADRYTAPVTSGGYKYYISNSGKSLCRKKISSEKVSKIATYKSISRFRILGKYILLEAWIGRYSNGVDKFCTYCMKLDGSAKKTLATWGES